MREFITFISQVFDAAVTGIRTAIAPENRRVTAAVMLGGLTIAAANWFAMSKPSGESVAGLGPDSAAGALFAPMYGGVVAGLGMEKTRCDPGASRAPALASTAAGLGAS